MSCLDDFKISKRWEISYKETMFLTIVLFGCSFRSRRIKEMILYTQQDISFIYNGPITKNKNYTKMKVGIFVVIWFGKMLQN